MKRVQTAHGMRVILPVVIRIEDQQGDRYVEGQLLHATARSPEDAMWWGILVYTISFPENRAHRL